jgi:hypothetical protein
MTLEVAPQRIPPVRGLVPVHNRKRQPFSPATVHRWIRLSRTVFKAQKLDLLAAAIQPDIFATYPAFARELHLKVSLRTDCTSEPPDVETLRAWDLFDVFLAPALTAESPELAWFEPCRDAGLPIRVQRFAVAPKDAEDYVHRARDCGVVAVHLTYFDFLLPAPLRQPSADITATCNFANALLAGGIEVNLHGFPLSLVPEHLRAHVVARERFFLDHEQYERRSYQLAQRLFDMSPLIAGKIIQTMQLRYTTAPSPVDRYFLEWLFCNHRFTYFWVLFFRKWFRERPKRGELPRPFREEHRASVEEMDRWLDDDWEYPGDAEEAFNRTFPGVTDTDTDWQPSSEWYRQPKYYDSIDRERAFPSETSEKLAEQARHIMANRAPDEIVDTNEYGTEGEFHEPLSNAVRWLSIGNTEKASNVVRWLEGPFTVAVTFAGGRAQYAGFRVGKSARMLVPMEDVHMRLAIHVAEDGSYVLLRDDQAVQPVEFEGRYYAPARLSFPVGLCLCVVNIDDHVSTQGVQIWHDTSLGLPPADAVKYSIVIFCTRFSRRLQAVLSAIAHQRDFDLAKLEVIIGYVPGADTTDDVVDSIRIAHPKLRVVRVPFSDEYLKSKGFVINECARLAKGDWIMLLDADIILPPDMFTRLEQQPADAVFVAPPGRHMLDRETTARILLGEIKPWREWDALLSASRDDRTGEAEGIPIGYCQVFRKSCLDKVQYAEYEHFEGADGDFGLAMRNTFGRELRLDGATVLHLDHGGSQWFGAYRHQ